MTQTSRYFVVDLYPSIAPVRKIISPDPDLRSSSDHDVCQYIYPQPTPGDLSHPSPSPVGVCLGFLSRLSLFSLSSDPCGLRVTGHSSSTPTSRPLPQDCASVSRPFDGALKRCPFRNSWTDLGRVTVPNPPSVREPERGRRTRDLGTRDGRVRGGIGTD